MIKNKKNNNLAIRNDYQVSKGRLFDKSNLNCIFSKKERNSLFD